MQSIAPAPVQSMQNQDINADNDLRAQLAAVINTNQHTHPHGYNDVHASSSASPHDHNIDPAIGGGAGTGGIMSGGNGGDSGGDDSLGERKGGKRELSQSKRAAQNRAAQRAFRQRKEGYIKKLEEQVRDLHSLEDNYKSLQAENYSLREYIIHLQSRLIESHGEFPQPPANINLNHPHHARHDGHLDQIQARHEAGAAAPLAPMNQLQANTARTIAAAGLQNSKHGAEDHGYEQNKRYKESQEDTAAADDEIIRSQLQASADGLPIVN